MPDFAPLFAAAHPGPIEVDGERLHLSLRLQLAPASRLHIIFESSAERPVQGLCISATRPKHRLTALGVSARELVLWQDTAPFHVEVALPSARTEIPVVIWNVWRDEKFGTMMYGMRSAAMRLHEEAPGKWLLQCSDGWGPDADFSDLVARVIVEPPVNRAT